MTAPVAERGGRRGMPDGSAGRLPAPTRGRRPALAGLAVLLIVGGALTSGLIALRSGEKVEYVAIRQTVEVGARIEASDLGVADLAGSGVEGIPASERRRLVGMYATRRLSKNTLAVRSDFSAKQQVPAGAAVVGVVLTAEQRPAKPLAVNDVVAVYVVPRTEDAEGEASLVVRAATVIETAETRAAGGAGLAVSLLVPDAKVAEVTLNAALRKIAVVKLPAGTTPDVAPGDG